MRKLLLEMAEQGDHLADALAGEILEIAGLVDLRDALLHFRRDVAAGAGHLRARHCAHAVVDRLGGGEHGLRRLLHRLDRRAELGCGARQTPPVPVAHERSEVALERGESDVGLGRNSAPSRQHLLDAKLFLLHAHAPVPRQNAYRSAINAGYAIAVSRP